MLPPKTSHHAKFHQIGQTSLEIGGVNWASDKNINLFCHGQKRDYLSRDSQCARGATKNC